MNVKYRYFYKPYLLVSLGLLIGYTSLNWLIITSFEMININDAIINWGIPFALGTFYTSFVILPKLKLLDLSVKKNSWDRFYIIISFIVFLVPLIIAQEYISSVAGKKSDLQSIKEIQQFRSSRYFTAEEMYIHKSGYSVHSDFYVWGKRGQYYNMNLFFAVPIYEKPEEADTDAPAAWLAFQKRKTIDNNLSKQQKDSEYIKFFNESTQKFLASDLNDYRYLKRLRESDFRQGAMNAIKRKNAHSMNLIILQSELEPFEERSGDKLSWLCGTYIFGTLIWFLMIALPKLNDAEIKKLKAGQLDVSAKNAIKGFIAIIKPRTGFFVTPILIYIVIGVFILMSLKGYGFALFREENLISWGAVNNSLIKDGQWFRLITNIFVHYGFVHILINAIALFVIGLFLESIIGISRFIFAFLTTGIFASASSIWWNDSIISSGTTGAIYGLLGVFVVLFISKSLPKSFNNFTPYVIFIPGFVGLLVTSIYENMDIVARIGGLISGIAIGIFFIKPVKPKIKKKSQTKRRR